VAGGVPAKERKETEEETEKFLKKLSKENATARRETASKKKGSKVEGLARGQKFIKDNQDILAKRKNRGDPKVSEKLKCRGGRPPGKGVAESIGEKRASFSMKEVVGVRRAE